jgi:O-antigen/teichoic acid export membrane protein
MSQRVWQGLAGFLTLLFITNILSSEEQGYYYVFLSIVAIQTVFDMGLSFILVQISAYESRLIIFDDKGKIKGNIPSRFISLFKKSLIWFAVLSVLLLLVLFWLGYYFISDSDFDHGYGWKMPWLLLIVFTAITFFFQPLFSLLEGAGHIREVYLVRFIQGLLGSIGLWLGFYFNLGIFSVCIPPAVGIVITILWVLFFKSNILTIIKNSGCDDFKWKEEVWPQQWRFGVSWLCAYFISQGFIPIIFKSEGLLIAGQMGLTIAIINMIGILSVSWMSSNFPRFVKLIALKNWIDLDREFYRAFFISLISYVIGITIFIIIRLLFVATIFDNRFLPFSDVVIMALSGVFSQVIILLGFNLRAYRKEPFMLSSIISTAVIIILSNFSIKFWGVSGLIWVIFFVNALIGVPISFIIYIRSNKTWRL